MKAAGMGKMRLVGVIGLVCLALCHGEAFGAGENSAPPIDISGAEITVTNGVATCCTGVEEDEIAFSVSGAVDYDGCGGQPGNRIDLALTRWFAASGSMDTPNGVTNK